VAFTSAGFPREGRVYAHQQYLNSGEDIKFKCDDGYSSTNGGRLQCTMGKLRGECVSNKLAKCYDNQLPAHARVARRQAGWDGVWKDTLMSGEYNVIECDDNDHTPTNDGKITCNDGATKHSAECKRLPCTNVAVPTNGKRTATWKDTLESGESNIFECGDGYTPTHDGKVTVDTGKLTEARCVASCVNVELPSQESDTADQRPTVPGGRVEEHARVGRVERREMRRRLHAHPNVLPVPLDARQQMAGLVPCSEQKIAQFRTNYLRKNFNT